MQDEANTVLENDSRFAKTYRQLRSRFTAGEIEAPRFRAQFRWAVEDCFRRAKINRVLARRLADAVSLQS